MSKTGFIELAPLVTLEFASDKMRTSPSASFSSFMAIQISKVAVLGAGTMGSRIAAHFANAGVPSYLLDIVPPGASPAKPGEGSPERDKIVAAGLEGAKKSKPAAFFDPSLARLIKTGNFEDDLKLLADADWIIEAVAENLEIKRTLLKKVEAVRKPSAIVTTNTSGLPVGSIVDGFSEAFRRNWFGTHFFNPPRYMRLLEIIPTPDSDPAAMQAIAQFCDQRLGKAIVQAKDTPNFIANRIGTFSVLNVMRIMQEMGLSIEEVDALTSWRCVGSGMPRVVRVVRGETREALAASDASAVCSGTATLEAALTGTPLVVVYKESALNWHTLGRLIEVEHYGLVNLIAGERVAPELLQQEFTGASLARELIALLDPARNAQVRSLLRGAASRLGEGGASLRAADAVLRAIREWKLGREYRV